MGAPHSPCFECFVVGKWSPPSDHLGKTRNLFKSLSSVGELPLPQIASVSLMECPGFRFRRPPSVCSAPFPQQDQLA